MKRTMMYAVALLAGCSSATKQLYPGPRRLPDEVAIIRAKGVQIVAIDGQSLASDVDIEILPGPHSVTVSSRFCVHNGSNSSCYTNARRCGPILFVAKPGKEYHAMDSADGRGVWVRIQEMQRNQVVLGVRVRDYPAVAECFGRSLTE